METQNSKPRPEQSERLKTLPWQGQNSAPRVVVTGLGGGKERAEAAAGASQTAVRSLGDRVDACFQRQALVRYDALEGAGGKQSVSIALLDAARKGIAPQTVVAQRVAAAAPAPTPVR